MEYEELLCIAEKEHLTVAELPLRFNDGRIRDDLIAIRKDIPIVKKSCVLAEELGHYYTSYGDILNQAVVMNRRQERRARLWAFDAMIGLSGMIKAKKAGCRSAYEVAEYLHVTEDLLKEGLEIYRQKYGPLIRTDDYLIRLEPAFDFVELGESA